LIEGISQFDIGEEKKEIFARDVIKVVDQLGGKDKRRIMGVIAEDNMMVQFANGGLKESITYFFNY
jgi:hypothetical protein